MSNRAKGRRNELRAKKALELDGYAVQIAPTPTRWARQTDLWGLWDLAAVDKDNIRFIQVKTNNKPSKEKMRAMFAWKCPEGCTKEIWIYKDRVKDPLVIHL